MNPTTPFTGGCACSAIRYASTATPVVMLHCHCRDCQQASGGPFFAFVFLPTETFKLFPSSPPLHSSPTGKRGVTPPGFCPYSAAPTLGKTQCRPLLVP